MIWTLTFNFNRNINIPILTKINYDFLPKNSFQKKNHINLFAHLFVHHRSDYGFKSMYLAYYFILVCGMEIFGMISFYFLPELVKKKRNWAYIFWNVGDWMLANNRLSAGYLYRINVWFVQPRIVAELMEVNQNHLVLVIDNCSQSVRQLLFLYKGSSRVFEKLNLRLLEILLVEWIYDLKFMH